MNRLKKIVLCVYNFHTSSRQRRGVRVSLSCQTQLVCLSSSDSVKKGGVSLGRLFNSDGSVSVLQ